MKLIRFILPIVAVAIVAFSCKDKKKEENPPINDDQTETGAIKGFNILDKIKGIWDGLVTSTTALGSYPKWVVDFRPISASHISAKNELDVMNDIHMAFFVTKYNGQNYVAFRNGGMFAGNTRTSYFLADSVSETATHSFYRFTEIIKGKSRAYTEVMFKDDSVTIKSFTNVYNTEETALPHMTWKAKRTDLTSCANAVSNFNFPQKVIAKDFSTALDGIEEAVFYNEGEGDPYTEDIYPYLGKGTVTYSYQGVTPSASNKTFLLLLTQPLFSPTTGYDPSSLNYISRYVTLDANDLDYTFNYMHPGSYYVYAIYDENGDGVFGSGDYINLNSGTLNLSAEGTANSSVIVNFQIP